MLVHDLNLSGDQCSQEEPEAMSPRRPATRGTSGTIQIRNCGEITLAKTTTAATEAANPLTSSSTLSSARRYANTTAASAATRAAS